MATDETDPVKRSIITASGGVFIHDLLTHEDRQNFGPMLMLTDVIALVEQALLAHSSYFYGARWICTPLSDSLTLALQVTVSRHLREYPASI